LGGVGARRPLCFVVLALDDRICRKGKELSQLGVGELGDPRLSRPHDPIGQSTLVGQERVDLLYERSNNTLPVW
jgi:hypothetical protein